MLKLSLTLLALCFLGVPALATEPMVDSGAAEPSQAPPEPAPEVVEKIQSTRESITRDEKSQREALSHLFLINQQVKDIAKKQAQLNQKLLSQEANVRTLAQEVQGLDQKSEHQKENLNRRLRQLYQERSRGDFHWLFRADRPIEIERNHRFLRLMVDSDHRQLKAYIRSLNHLKQKRGQLKEMVGHLAGLQKEIQKQEQTLSAQMSEKSRLLNELRRNKDLKISELKDLRVKTGADNLQYAFFERKGSLKPPVDQPLAREYGTYVDPQFKFRLAHKGMFFATPSGADVRAVSGGEVVFANQLPGLGRTVILDHGDNYYSVYAFAKSLKVREGIDVREGDIVAVSGGTSPLFGPGLYFEIRHFTDAIDPRPWIKDSVIKTANF